MGEKGPALNMGGGVPHGEATSGARMGKGHIIPRPVYSPTNTPSWSTAAVWFLILKNSFFPKLTAAIRILIFFKFVSAVVKCSSLVFYF
jgi:hypothetical protein